MLKIIPVITGIIPVLNLIPVFEKYFDTTNRQLPVNYR